MHSNQLLADDTANGGTGKVKALSARQLCQCQRLSS